MNTDHKLEVLVIGSTGRQGGAVARRPPGKCGDQCKTNQGEADCVLLHGSCAEDAI